MNRQTDLAPVMTRCRKSMNGQDWPSSRVTSLFHCNTNTLYTITGISFLSDNASTSHNLRYRRKDVTSDFIQILILNIDFKRIILLDLKYNVIRMFFHIQKLIGSVTIYTFTDEIFCCIICKNTFHLNIAIKIDE